MQIHQLKRKTELKKTAPVGRGGKRGKTSGRGTKGQKARAGRKIYPQMRDVIKRLPKLRGYFFRGRKIKAVSVTLQDLAKAFPKGGNINPKLIVEAGLASSKSRMPQIKILSKGAVTQKFNISNCFISAKAKDEVIKAGGAVK